MIPIYNPNILSYKSSAIKAIETGWISNHGIYVKKANDKLKEILNTKHTILMANGTCATHCLFLALKYKFPTINKIYVSNNCYVAAWNALLMEYDKTFIDVMKMNLETFNIETSEEYIMSLEKNAAVLIVHNLGNIVNVPRLKSMRPDLIFMEDNCEGLFGKYNGIFSGTSNDSLCSSISFYGNKTITTGEGGAFLTNDDEIYNYIIKAYSQGLSSQRYLHDTHAYNYRMTNIQAAFLYDQLNDLDNILSKKQTIFEKYNDLLEPLIQNNKVKIFEREKDTKNANWIYAIRIIDNYLNHEETYTFLKDEGMDSRPFFYPINSHEHLKDIVFEDNIAYKLNKEVIMIPSSPDISLEEQQQVVDIIHKLCFYLDTSYKIIEINNNIETKNLLNTFIDNIRSTSFRYFNKRSVDVIQNHLLTLLVMDNNNPIGYAHIDQEDGKYWFGICISDQHQNKGLGNHIMKYILHHYKIKYCKEIYLSVDNNNINAIKLYKKNNFKETKINDSYTLMNYFV